jgi:hypothetical protein
MCQGKKRDPAQRQREAERGRERQRETERGRDTDTDTVCRKLEFHRHKQTAENRSLNPFDEQPAWVKKVADIYILTSISI